MLARRLVVAIAALVAGLTACGGDDDPTTRADAPTEDQSQEPSDTPTVDAPSTPFTVGPAPEGYALVSAGEGTVAQEWGSDSFGTDEPFTVLAPEGAADGTADDGSTGDGSSAAVDPDVVDPDAVVLVSVTGFEGYQGGLDQAVGGSPAGTELTDVDGRDARFVPATGPTEDWPDGRWADLVVDHGDDLAVRVTAPDATRDELEAVHAAVVPAEDHARAPSVPEPPAGLEVVGSVDVVGVLAAGGVSVDVRDSGPGPVGAHGVGWQTAAEDRLAVLTLPPDTVDLDTLAAVPSGAAARWSDQTVARRADGHVVLETVVPEDDFNARYESRSVWTIAEDGGVVVAAAAGESTPDEGTLLALVRSVEPTDQATWDAFVTDVGGGPGFHADPGRTELARGTAPDGREWLLQDQEPDDAGQGVTSVGPSWAVDPCLKVDDGSRACPTAQSRNAVSEVSTTGEDEEPTLHHVIVTTIDPAVDHLAVTTDGVTERVEFVPVPGTDQRAAVVVGEGYQVRQCATDASEVDGPRTIVLADAAGEVVACPS